MGRNGCRGGGNATVSSHFPLLQTFHPVSRSPGLGMGSHRRTCGGEDGMVLDELIACGRPNKWPIVNECSRVAYVEGQKCGPCAYA